MITSFSLTTYAQSSRIDFSDSANVKKFTLTHSICEQINIAIKYKLIMVEENNYSKLLLQSISKLLKCKFYISIAGRYNGTYSKDQQAAELEEQLFDIKKKLNCYDQ